METKDKSWKIVKQDSSNEDQYLLGFFNSETHAQENIPYILRKYNRDYITSADSLLIKPVNPEKIYMPVCTDYMHYVRSLIPKQDWERVMDSDTSVEIDENSLMCGGATYYYLSRMIQREWTVIDIGASYGAQSYLFQNHARYIAVEPAPKNYGKFVLDYFVADGTERYTMTAKAFIEEILPTLDLDINKTFAICNYVPDWYGQSAQELVRKTFKNLFVYYPN